MLLVRKKSPCWIPEDEDIDVDVEDIELRDDEEDVGDAMWSMCRRKDVIPRARDDPCRNRSNRDACERASRICCSICIMWLGKRGRSEAMDAARAAVADEVRVSFDDADDKDVLEPEAALEALSEVSAVKLVRWLRDPPRCNPEEDTLRRESGRGVFLRERLSRLESVPRAEADTVDEDILDMAVSVVRVEFRDPLPGEPPLLEPAVLFPFRPVSAVLLSRDVSC